MTVAHALKILKRAYKLHINFDHAVYAKIKARHPEIAYEVAVQWWGN